MSWSKPPAMTKQRRVHRVPISDETACGQDCTGFLAVMSDGDGHGRGAPKELVEFSGRKPGCLLTEAPKTHKIFRAIYATVPGLLWANRLKFARASEQHRQIAGERHWWDHTERISALPFSASISVEAMNLALRC